VSANFTRLLKEGYAVQQQGNWRDAIEHFRAALDLAPDEPAASFLLGTALLQAGEISESLLHLEASGRHWPDDIDVSLNLGVAYLASGRTARAKEQFEAALRLAPTDPRPVYNLGLAHEAEQEWPRAARFFLQAAACEPRDDMAWKRGIENLARAHDWAEVERVIRARRITVGPNRELNLRLATALAEQRRLDEAIECCREVLIDQPDDAEILSGLSTLLEQTGALEAAEQAARLAIEIAPGLAEGWNNLGNALRALHRLDDAEVAFRRAIEIRPGFALAEFNLGTTHLLAGNYRAGWAGYEQRERLAPTELLRSNTPQSRPVQPPRRWDGEAFPGGILLVRADQGLGDTLQFSRYLPQLAERFRGKVVLACQPTLCEFFRSANRAENVISLAEADRSAFDFEFPIGSLPGLFQTTIDTIPPPLPELDAANSLRQWPISPAALETLERAPRGSLRVGLVWQGNPRQSRDSLRSCRLADFTPVLEVPGVTFFSLQKEAGVGSSGLLNLAPFLQDFAHTAAIVGRLDLVISVDTSTAHLAGTLRVPVWTLLSHTPDWRWHLQRSDSPWYPTMRLFRQPGWGDWSSLMREVASALHALPGPEV